MSIWNSYGSFLLWTVAKLLMVTTILPLKPFSQQIKTWKGKWGNREVLFSLVLTNKVPCKSIKWSDKSPLHLPNPTDGWMYFSHSESEEIRYKVLRLFTYSPCSDRSKQIIHTKGQSCWTQVLHWICWRTC